MKICFHIKIAYTIDLVLVVQINKWYVWLGKIKKESCSVCVFFGLDVTSDWVDLWFRKKWLWCCLLYVVLVRSEYHNMEASDVAFHWRYIMIIVTFYWIHILRMWHFITYNERIWYFEIVPFPWVTVQTEISKQEGGTLM